MMVFIGYVISWGLNPELFIKIKEFYRLPHSILIKDKILQGYLPVFAGSSAISIPASP